MIRILKQPKVLHLGERVNTDKKIKIWTVTNRWNQTKTQRIGPMPAKSKSFSFWNGITSIQQYSDVSNKVVKVTGSTCVNLKSGWAWCVSTLSAGVWVQYWSRCHSAVCWWRTAAPPLAGLVGYSDVFRQVLAWLDSWSLASLFVSSTGASNLTSFTKGVSPPASCY